MPQSIRSVVLIATKLADGNVQLVFQNSVGGIKFMAVVPAADFTALNTSVNGGSTGATKTLSYNQDQNRNDYPHGYHSSEGN